MEQCGANVGDIISTIFYVPAMIQNGYYDRIEAKLVVVQPYSFLYKTSQFHKVFCLDVQSYIIVALNFLHGSQNKIF